LREQDAIADDIKPLCDVLDAADYITVYDFLEDILSGPIGARRKFVARFGTEALVPIEEMLNTALQFQQQQGGGLQSFLGWFDRGDIEIKREGVGSVNEVRVMTVHGSKGLQAPVVFLADTTSDPGKKPDRSAELLIDDGKRVPLLPIRSHEQTGLLLKVVEKQKLRELQEHRRLLYVAMTRAEERLIMGGSLGPSRKGEAPADSWYMALERGMLALGCQWQSDTRWGQVMRYEGSEGVTAKPDSDVSAIAEIAAPAIGSPEWLFTEAPQESRPPRPLVPSRIEDDEYGDAPASLAMRAAAERGKLLHALFERITDAGSLAAATQWLEANVRDPAVDKKQLIATVAAVITKPEWSLFFSPAARAEVPLAAVVGETVITGRVDRLVIEPGLVRLIDFKTGRSVPDDESGVIVPHLRQMAHYVAALEMIFPGSVVEASLLFTYAPRLIKLSDVILAPYKPVSSS
jgi:ATP-dependent helicase/nuclease subunit A